MIRVGCAACGGSVISEDLPTRLPIVVPDHLGHDGHTCAGSGTRSPLAWMVNPFEGADRPVSMLGFGRPTA